MTKNIPVTDSTQMIENVYRLKHSHDGKYANH